MHKNSIGNRVQQAREHFKLTRKQFVQVINVHLSTVSRIETDVQAPTDLFLDALMARFLVNPDWILTGEGEMLLSPEEYIEKGITILGGQKFSEGLANVLNNPQFAEFQSSVTMSNSIKEDLDTDLKEVLQLVSKLWRQGDERSREMLAQVVKSFSAVGEKSREKDK